MKPTIATALFLLAAFLIGIFTERLHSRSKEPECQHGFTKWELDGNKLFRPFGPTMPTMKHE